MRIDDGEGLRRGLVAAVAAAYVGISLIDGGASIELIAAVAIASWTIVLLGIGVRILSFHGVPLTGLTASACLVTFAGFTAVSVIWGSDDGRAFIELVRVSAYAGVFCLLLMAAPAGSARSLLLGLALGIVAISIAALGSRFLAPGTGNEEIAKLLPSASGRLSFPVGYWNALGSICAAGVVLLCWLGEHARTRRARSTAIAAIPLLALTIFYTQSRGGLLAAAVGLGVLLLFGTQRLQLALRLALGSVGSAALIALAVSREDLVDGIASTTSEAQGREMLAAAVVAFVAVAIAIFLLDRRIRASHLGRGMRISLAALFATVVIAGLAILSPIQRFEDFKAPPAKVAVAGPERLASAAGSGRYQYWETAFDAFKASPVEGIGAGGYEAWWNQHGSITTVVHNAHSIVLETLAELGLVGLILLLGFLISIPIGAFIPRNGRISRGSIGVALAVVATTVCTLLIDWTWEIPAVTLPLLIAAAALTGKCTRTSVVGTGAPRPLMEDRPTFRAAGFALASLGVVIGAIGFATENRLRASERAVEDGDLKAADSYAAQAAAVQPWSAEPMLQLALVQERLGELEPAKANIDDAITKAPEDWRLYLVLSRIEVKIGDISEAEAALARSRSLNPRASIFDALSEGGAG